MDFELPQGLGPLLYWNCAFKASALRADVNATFSARAEVFGVVKAINSPLEVFVRVVRYSRSPMLNDGPPSYAGGTFCASVATASIRQSPRLSLLMSNVALTREQKGREAPLLRVGVERVVMHQFVMPYFCFKDFLTNSASKTRPTTSGFSLKQTMMFVALGFRMM